MKVIDLLNKIANGEEVPRVQYDDIEAYIGADGYLKDSYGDNVEWWIDKNWLNTEVEIIEEDKKIRKVYIFSGLDDDYAYEEGNSPNNVKINNKIEEFLIEKINEIIDKLNETEKE